MKLTTKTLAFTFALIVSSYANASTTDEAIASAETARKAAAEVGYEWRDTGKMIKKAKELAAKGKNEDAIKLAKKAEEEGKDALKQYRSELNRYSKTH
ncbi:MAG: hypothetical protein HOM14_20755 [Gammaproteobacteria bacterium]|jgi:methanogenic corrinoid protein MtbC1|nr:hypothetical protein [Gammaproteobacteria bacterium]MBT4196893.1 hypothetical protein [Gammaproteobacteria bacterium]MBT6553792.1 hypothetical protein [Gammaproteobacteria bacterium]MBT7044750.1 hypothetical protein [Gammaproteobacteria bacterium]MBT7209097.1 hypothetical protein [Gammaproteobacteria bacterium]